MHLLRPVVRWTAAILLWIVVAICLTATVLPFFLDRIYYRGPASAHYDGAHFYNPDGDDLLRSAGNANPPGFLSRQIYSDPARPLWPDHVAVTPAKVPAHVEGSAMLATWVGHATLLVQTQGINILTDPVWSDRVGPFGIGPARVAAPGIAFDALPRIDVVLVSHNHYDHMDLDTLARLWKRDRPLVVTSLGNDSVIAGAGVPARALDWGQRAAVRPGIEVAVTRNHHWGSRWFADRDRALWSSFVVTLPGGNFFFAGDTGAGDLRWPAEAAALGPIRLAAIPIGAFRFAPGQMASGNHIGPREAIRVWDGLGRPFALPVHWGTFRLSWEGYWTPPRLLHDMMVCAGSDPARFAAAALGRPVQVPGLDAPERGPDMAAVAECERNHAFDALR